MTTSSSVPCLDREDVAAGVVHSYGLASGRAAHGACWVVGAGGARLRSGARGSLLWRHRSPPPVADPQKLPPDQTFANRSPFSRFPRRIPS